MRNLLAALAFAALAPGYAAGQVPRRVNIYRYVLDIDVPESPGLVALDATGNHVLRGASPKPIVGNVILRAAGGGEHATGAAVDIVPYFLLGGGKRTLASYRDMSVAGRLTRVITKTSLSIAALTTDNPTGALRLGLALRTTFHDPHDPISTTRLPELVDSVLAAHGVREDDPNVEHLGDRGVNLRSVYADARREVSRHRDVQVTGGWGVAAHADGAVFDSLRAPQHTFWMTAQHAFGYRLDLLGTLQLRDAFHDDRKLRFGLGIQRKSHAADYRAELSYDGANRRLNPGVSAELRAGNGIGAVAAIGTDSEVGAGRTPRIIRATLLIRWYASSESP